MSTFIKKFNTEEEYTAWLSGYTGGRPAAAYVLYPNAGNSHFVPFYLILNGELEEDDFDYTTTATTLDINCNSNWNVSASTDWIQLSTLSGNGESTIPVTIGGNYYSSSVRTGNIVLSHQNSAVTFSITQNGNPDYMPDNEVWYTSTTSAVCSFNNVNFGGLSIVNNVYEYGKGIITLSGNLEEISCGYSNLDDSVLSLTLPFSLRRYNGIECRGSSQLAEIKLRDGLTEMNNNCFNDIKHLTTYNIPSTVKKIDTLFRYRQNYPLLDNTISAITIPEGVESLGGVARAQIEDSDGLRHAAHSNFTISIPSSLSAIGENICNIPTLTRIEGGYTGITSDNRICYTGNTIVAIAGEGAGNFVIPNNFTAIKAEVLECSGLTSVTINDNINIDNSYDVLFRRCSDLTAIYGNNPNVIDNKYIVKSSGFLCGMVEINDSEFIVPSQVKKVYDYFLKRSYNGGIIHYPNLKRVIFQEGFESADLGLCSGLDTLEYIEFPSTTTYVGYGFLSLYSPNLTIVIKATTPPSLRSTGLNAPNGKIYVPDASVDAYKAATKWNLFASMIYPISELIN